MRKAFTLIELMVVMALIAVMAGSGAAISLSAGRKKAVDSAAEDLASAMRQARDYVQAGKKDATCGVVPLDGWQVAVDVDGYTVQGKCGSTYFGNPKKAFLNGAKSTSGTVFFNPLSLGAVLSGVPFTLSANGYTKTVTVTKNGEVGVQ